MKGVVCCLAAESVSWLGTLGWQSGLNAEELYWPWKRWWARWQEVVERVERAGAGRSLVVAGILLGCK